jgi:hypothetical protein
LYSTQICVLCVTRRRQQTDTEKEKNEQVQRVDRHFFCQFGCFKDLVPGRIRLLLLLFLGCTQPLISKVFVRKLSISQVPSASSDMVILNKKKTMTATFLLHVSKSSTFSKDEIVRAKGLRPNKNKSPTYSWRPWP